MILFVLFRRFEIQTLMIALAIDFLGITETAHRYIPARRKIFITKLGFLGDGAIAHQSRASNEKKKKKKKKAEVEERDSR